jgi:hypothetical protein
MEDTLKMEAAWTSETLVSYRATLRGVTSQKISTCFFIAVKTSNLSQENIVTFLFHKA